MRSRYENVKGRVVFVHGAGGGAWEWAIWRRGFAAQGWNVIARDLQPAECGLAQTRLQNYAGQVEDWMRAGAGEGDQGESVRSVLVGASLGGLLALSVAQRVVPAALVLVNPLPPAGIEPRRESRQWPDIVAWGSARSFASTCRAMPDADDAARWFAFRRWRDESGCVLREASRGAAVDVVTCPMLIFAGERDADVAPAASRTLAEIHGAEFRLLHGAGHLSPLLGRIASAVAQDAADWCARSIRGIKK